MNVRLERSQPSLLHAMTAHADMSRAIRITAMLFVTVLGSRLGASAQVLYLAAGIAGLPVFAASPVLPQGIARLLGPTGGYLMSYPFAAFVAGYLAERRFDRRYLTSVVAMGAGLAIVFAFGISWIAWGAPHSGLSVALASGLYPFLPADVLKVFAAAAVLPAAWRFLR
jgi:biotin transport system substrate-specific component